MARTRWPTWGCKACASPALKQVLARVRQAAEAQPRARLLVVFLYLHDRGAAFDDVGGFVPLFSWRRFDVFECQPAP